MKRLLVLAPSFPFPPRDGVQLRLNNLLRRLPDECVVTLLCFSGTGVGEPEPLPDPLRGESIEIRQPVVPGGFAGSQLAQVVRPEPSLVWKFHSSEMSEMVRRRAAKADAVLAVGLQMAQYLELVPPGIPTALDNYNVEHRILARMARTRPALKRWYWLLEARKLRSAERRLMRRAGTVFAISEVDRQALEGLAPGSKICTVPMGIDLDYFGADAVASPARPPRFTFVGVFNWHVNEDAAAWLCGEIWPRVRAELPEAELHLVGRDPSEAVRALGKDPSVQVSGTVPDVRPYLWESTALLVPLRYGSGVRTKILEAFAAGRPVISTSIGCEGLPVRSGEHLVVADDAVGFASACVRLASRPDEAAVLVAGGRALVEEQDRAATLQLRQACLQAFCW